jgi:hypothetical protein
MEALWTRRSGSDLVGSTINVTTGAWINTGMFIFTVHYNVDVCVYIVMDVIWETADWLVGLLYPNKAAIDAYVPVRMFEACVCEPVCVSDSNFNGTV